MWIQVSVYLVNHRTNIPFNTITVTHSVETHTEFNQQGVPEKSNIYICTLCPKAHIVKVVQKQPNVAVVNPTSI